jgi:hypothetical protein
MSSVLSPLARLEIFYNFFLSRGIRWGTCSGVACRAIFLHTPEAAKREKTWINIVFSRPLTDGFIRCSIPRWAARWKAWQGVVYRAAFPAHVTAGWEACPKGTIYVNFLGIFVNLFLAENDQNYRTLDRRNIFKPAAFFKLITGTILHLKKIQNPHLKKSRLLSFCFIIRVAPALHVDTIRII